MRTQIAAILTFGIIVTAAWAQEESKPSADIIYQAGYGDESGGYGPIPVRMDAVTYLGVTAAPVSLAMSSQLNLPEGLGLLVTHVAPDSPASAAGLLKHDILHKLDDQLLTNFSQFTTLIRLRQPGDTVGLSIIRGGEPITIDATLGEHQVPKHSIALREHPGAWVPKPNTPPHDIWVAPASNVEVDRLHAELLRGELLRAEPGRRVIFPHDFTSHTKDRYKLRILDEGYKINISKLTDDDPRVIVEDAGGNVLHDGAWDPDTDPTASGLPENITKQINNILASPTPGHNMNISADTITITAPPAVTE